MAASAPSTKVSLNIEPSWAQNAVNLTSDSLEIKFDQLRDLFIEKDPDHLEDLAHPQIVSITLSPRFIGKPGEVDRNFEILSENLVNLLGLKYEYPKFGIKLTTSL